MKPKPKPLGGFCRQCSKVAYPGFRIAVRGAIAYSQEHGRPYRPYRCPRGLGWHLTTRAINGPITPAGIAS